MKVVIFGAGRRGLRLARHLIEEKKQVMLEQLDMMIELKGEYGAVREMRKFVGWYLKGAPGSAAFRGSVNQITNAAELKRAIEEF